MTPSYRIDSVYKWSIMHGSIHAAKRASSVIPENTPAATDRHINFWCERIAEEITKLNISGGVRLLGMAEA